MSAARVDRLLANLDRLPADLRTWLRDGLRQWQQGSNLEIALQIDAPALSLDARDDMLRAIIKLLPCDPDVQISFFLGLIGDGRRHPDATGQRLLEILIASRCYVPRTARHLRRILQHRRSDGWRGTFSGLCPHDAPGEDDAEQIFFGVRNIGQI